MKKRLALILLVLSYALVFWCSPDAVAPLAMLVPYLLIGGSAVISVELLASAIGFVGIMIACGAFWKKEKAWQIVAALVLGLSVAAFISSSSRRLLSVATAIPFVGSAAFSLRRAYFANENRAQIARANGL